MPLMVGLVGCLSGGGMCDVSRGDVIVLQQWLPR